MAYVMANDFPLEFCAPDPELYRFVMTYVDAWLSGLLDGDDLSKQCFEGREKFIDLWEFSEYDLVDFKKSEFASITKILRKLRAMGMPPNLRNKFEDEPENIIAMRRDGEITDEEFRKFGPSLVCEYVMALNGDAEDEQAESSNMRDLEEYIAASRLDTRRRAFGVDPRRCIDWDSRLVSALRGAYDVNLPAPKQLRVHPRPAPLRRTWIEKQSVWDILRSGLKEVKKDVGDIADQMAKTGLASDN